MKQVIAHNCDFLRINNGLPVCTHPKRSKTSQFCHPFDLACEDAKFEKIYNVPEKDKNKPICLICRHFKYNACCLHNRPTAFSSSCSDFVELSKRGDSDG